MNIPSFESYGNYPSDNYGVSSLKFTDSSSRTFYFSCKTLVAFRTAKTGLVCLKNYWGPTTGKHLNWIQPDHSKRIKQAEFDKLLTTI